MHTIPYRHKYYTQNIKIITHDTSIIALYYSLKVVLFKLYHRGYCRLESQYNPTYMMENLKLVLILSELNQKALITVMKAGHRFYHN